MGHRVRLAVLFAALATFVLAASPVAAQPAPPAGTLSLHFIDVGQGDSTLILCPNGATILIDAGSLPLSTVTRDRVRAYITGQIAPLGGDIDTLILTHPDTDHSNMLRTALAGVPVGRGYFVGPRSSYADPAVFDFMRTTPAAAVELTAGDFDRETTPNPDIDCGAARIWILAAAIRSSFSSANTKSIVVMVRMGDFEAVITGDATRDTEAAILARYSPAFLDVDVLRIGHHGSLTTSTTVPWASVLTPRTAIFSAGNTNGFGHPRREITDRVTPHTDTVAPHPFRDAIGLGGRRYRWTTRPAVVEGVYATATSGTIVIRTAGTGYSLAENQR